MYINRRTFSVKMGCMDSAVELLKAEEANVQPMVESLQPVLMTSIFGTFDKLVWEGRFESMADYEKFWADWVELPTSQKFFETWVTLTEPGGLNELWEVR